MENKILNLNLIKNKIIQKNKIIKKFFHNQKYGK